MAESSSPCGRSHLRAIADGEERRIRFSRPVCSEQVSASETLPILPGWNNPALELLICDCPGDRHQPVTQGCQTRTAVPERPLAHDLTGGIEKANLMPL